jgi:phosphatidylglycerol---prolipoprotein diacylglyceryl transferase
MHPIIEIGPFRVGTYFVMNVLAVTAFVVGIVWRVRRRPLPYPITLYSIIDLSFFVVLGSYVGAWFVSILPAAVTVLAGAPIVEGWESGGLRWPGAVGGGALAWYLYCRWRQVPPGPGFDVAAPLVPLTLAIVRIGCINAGCCYGWEATAWPALYLPDANGFWASRYPTQLISLIVNLALFALLLTIEQVGRRRAGRYGWPFEGALFTFYLLFFGAQDFFYFFLRADAPRLWGTLSWNHLWALIFVGVGAGVMARQWNRGKPDEKAA